MTHIIAKQSFVHGSVTGTRGKPVEGLSQSAVKDLLARGLVAQVDLGKEEAAAKAAAEAKAKEEAEAAAKAAAEAKAAADHTNKMAADPKNKSKG